MNLKFLKLYRDADPDADGGGGADDDDMNLDPDPGSNGGQGDENLNDKGTIDLDEYVKSDEYGALSPEERQRFVQEHLQKDPKGGAEDYLDDEGDPKGGSDDDDELPENYLDEDGLFGFSEEMLEKVPTQVIAKMEEYKAQMDDLGEYSDPKVREGVNEFLNDPIIASRVAYLRGDGGGSSMDQVFDLETLSRLDFKNDPSGSIREMSRLFASTKEGHFIEQVKEEARQSVEMKYKMKDFLRDVVALDPRNLKDSEKDILAPDHKISKFVKWSFENSSKVNIMELGPADSYELFLKRTGGLEAFNVRAKKSAITDVKKSMKDAAKKSISMGRHGKSTAATRTDGIDVQRLRKDDAYRVKLMEKYSDNSDKRKEIIKLAKGV